MHSAGRFVGHANVESLLASFARREVRATLGGPTQTAHVAPPGEASAA